MCWSTKSEEQKKSQALDAELKRGKNAARSEHKILLLGPGESGKSTIFKQMKLIQEGGGFTDAELLSYKQDIYCNAISQIRILLRGAANANFRFDSEILYNAASTLLTAECSSGNPSGVPDFTPELGKLIKTVWGDPKLKAFYSNHDDRKFQTNDTAHYFWDNIDRICEADYCPSVLDVVHVRIRTTGIREATFKFGEVMFKVVDVGGQRSERRKWIHCFDCVTCVIFCASLSDYDQNLREERSVNRLDEAIELFEDVYNSNYFMNSAVILFLNKTDLFKEKIKRIPLSAKFTSYEGGDDFQKATEFIQARFIEVAHNGKNVFCFPTCAINTENIRLVIQAVKRQILQNFTREFIL